MTSHRSLIHNHLAQAEQAVRHGRAHVNRQIDLIAELERDGHDTSQARALLRTFQQVLAEHEADRKRVLAEMHAPD